MDLRSGKSINQVVIAKSVEVGTRERNIRRREIETEAKKAYSYKEMWESLDRLEKDAETQRLSEMPT